MKPLRRLLIRIRNTVTRSQLEARIKEEIEEHIALQTAENIRAGMAPAEARRQARLKFGGIEAIKEDYRAEHGIALIETIFRDLRYGFRTMRRSPGFTAVALLTLALGIGANAVIFSAINGILIEHLPYANAGRLVTIKRESLRWGITSGEVRTILKQCPAFERIAIADSLYSTVTIGDASPAGRINAEVSGDFFTMLGVKPILGRFILPGDTEPGAPPVAVLNYNFWIDGFGGDERVVGRDIAVGATHYSVIGVMPKRFDLALGWLTGREQGVWRPLVTPEPKRGYGDVAGYLKEGVPLSVAQAQLDALSPGLADRFPKGAEKTALVAAPPKLRTDKDVRTALLILQCAVAFVLLLACVNLSALLVARSWSRQRDLAIRKALGAGRWRIAWQSLAESLVLALSGGALGLLLAAGGIRVLRAIAPPRTPRLDLIQLDPDVLWFTFAISVIAALLFGLLPALRPSMTQRQRFSRSALLILEVGLAVVLVIGGALTVRSFVRIMNIDTGVQAARALTMKIELGRSPFTILEELSSLPGVERAALSFGDPLAGGGKLGAGILFDDQQARRPYDGVLRMVTPGFFQTAGIRLLEGRDFVSGDRAVAIVSEAFAKRYIMGNPIGRRFSTYEDKDGAPVWLEIVGVVGNTRNRAVTQFNTDPPYYTPFAGGPQWQAIIRTSGDPTAMIPAIQGVVRSVDKAAIITDTKTWEQALDESAAMPRFQAALFGVFGLLALLLAMIGIYGVTSYSVRQRTHEIGVRMALGARAEDVTRGIVMEGGALALGGIAAGLAAARVAVRSLQSMLFEIQPADVATFAGVAALLFLAALAACYLPARAATQVDPIATLRHE